VALVRCAFLRAVLKHVDELARLYLGVDKYPFHREGDVRVLFRIAPERVATMESAMPDFNAST